MFSAEKWQLEESDLQAALPLSSINGECLETQEVQLRAARAGMQRHPTVCGNVAFRVTSG